MKNIKTFKNFVTESTKHTIEENIINESAIDKMNAEDKKRIETILDSVLNLSRGAFWKDLYDHTQTHAIYGLHTSNIDSTKAELTKRGAKKFRIVKNSGHPIICFDATKMK